MKPVSIASRADLSVYTMELPPLSGTRLRSAIRLRLLALYPGDLDEADIDYIRQNKETNCYLVFVRQADSRGVEASVSARPAPGRQRLPELSTTLAGIHKGPRDKALLVWTHEWASLEIFKAGSCIEGRAVVRSSSPDADWLSLSKGNTAACTEIWISDECRNTGDFPSSLSARESLSLESVIASCKPEDIALFQPEKSWQRRRPGLLVCLCAADIIILGLCPLFLMSSLERRRDASAEQLKAIMARKGRTLEITEEAEKKEKAYADYISGRGPDLYILLSELAKGLPAGSRVLSFSSAGAEFRMQVRGPAALKTVQNLQRSEYLDSIRLIQSKPIGGGVEEYTLAGASEK